MTNDYTTLYLIGNGFDLFHCLPTKYSDFHTFLKHNFPDLEEDLQEYFMLKCDVNYLWKSFEDDLQTFNNSYFFEHINEIDPLEEGFKLSQIYGLEDDLQQAVKELISKLKEAFFSWVDSIIIDDVPSKCVLKSNSFFISFNYTMVLEEIYKIPTERILHVHGDVINDFEELIFGHGASYEEEETFDKNGEPTRTPFTNALSISKNPLYSLQKKVDAIISGNLEKFESFKDVKEIIVLGHSLGDVDIPYFKKISFYAKNAFWRVSFYNDDEEVEFKSKLQSIGINEGKIQMFKL